jgi:hypothetical protein
MSQSVKPCESLEARQFDFWLGEWDLTWPAEQTGGGAGEIGRATNSISQMFGDCVIEENFAFADDSFLGHSVSVYDARAGMWRQTWVDNQGGYLMFVGSYDGETMELRTPEVEGAVQRMVFSNIADDSLNWDWQGSRDGGATWNDLWNIKYKRRS